MRAVLQRVSQAWVEIDGRVVGQIGPGWLILLGVAQGDIEDDASWMAEKIANLRAFEDEAGKMNRSLVEIAGGALVVSQFTLLADCRSGRRPSFTGAADPTEAERLYLRTAELLRSTGLDVPTGVFRATMKVSLVNEGPVTLLLDSRKAF